SVEGRFEVVSDTTKDDITAIVDFAHTPDSLEKTLQTLARITHHRIISVFGCGGDRGGYKRRIMAEIRVTHTDVVVLTSENPRTEEPKQLMDEMTNTLAGVNYCPHINRKDALHHATNLAEKNDFVLITVKGHEDYYTRGSE